MHVVRFYLNALYQCAVKYLCIYAMHRIIIKQKTKDKFIHPYTKCN